MKPRVPIFVGLVLASCAHAALDRTQSHGSRQAGVKASEVVARGFEVEVETDSDTLLGELIAVDGANVYVNTSRGYSVTLVTIPRSRIRQVLVEVTPSASSDYGSFTAVGCASTLSHGFHLILTGPAWLATGIPVAASEAATSTAKAGRGDLDRLWQFARFPQGLPPSWGGPIRHRPAAASETKPTRSPSTQPDAASAPSAVPAGESPDGSPFTIDSGTSIWDADRARELLESR